MRLARIRAERRRAARELEEANDGVAFLEDDLRIARDKARDLEKRLKTLRDEEEGLPREPEEVRCVCGEDLLVRRSHPRSAAHPEDLVFDRPPASGEDAGSAGGGMESCPGCGMDPEDLVEILCGEAAPTREQLARSRDLQPALVSLGSAGDGTGPAT